MLVTDVFRSHLNFSKNYNLQGFLCGPLNYIGNIQQQWWSPVVYIEQIFWLKHKKRHKLFKTFDPPKMLQKKR